MKKLILFSIFCLLSQLTFSQLKIEYEVPKINCLNETNTVVEIKIKCPSACSIIVVNKNKNDKWNYLSTIDSDSKGNAIYKAKGLRVGKKFTYGFYNYSLNGKINRSDIMDEHYQEKEINVEKKCK